MSEIINLRSFKLIRLVLDQNPFEGKAPGRLCNQEMSYDTFDKQDEPNRRLMLLRIKGTLSAEGQSQAAIYEVTGAAEFDVPPDLSAANKRMHVVINGGMILYGLIRGQLALVTGSFPSGSVLLPAINWAETVREIERKKAAAHVKQPVPLSTEKPNEASGVAKPLSLRPAIIIKKKARIRTKKPVP